MKLGDLVVNRETEEVGVVIDLNEPGPTEHINAPAFIKVLTDSGIVWSVRTGRLSETSWEVIA